MPGHDADDTPAKVAGRAAARRAEELAARRTDRRSGQGRFFDQAAAKDRVKEAQARAERALERAAEAHDAAARLHDDAAARLEAWSSTHPSDQGDSAGRSDTHRRSAVADRQGADADRDVLGALRGVPPAAPDEPVEPPMAG